MNKYDLFDKMEETIQTVRDEPVIYRAILPFVCPKCGHLLIWGGDHDMEMYGDGDDTVDGIVSNYSCSNSECNIYVEVYDSCEE